MAEQVNPIPLPPRSAARDPAKRGSRASPEKPVSVPPPADAPAESTAALRMELAERDTKIADLEAKLNALTTMRADLVEQSTDRDDEIALLRQRNNELTELATRERERADAAEERVRDLRFTAEESRRAIMRLQQEADARTRAKHDSPRTESEDRELKHSRRASLVVGRALHSVTNDGEAPADRGSSGRLRGLMLAGSPTLGQDGFAPQPGGAPQPGAASPPKEGEESAEVPAPPAEEGTAPGARGLGISARLREGFSMLRRPPPARDQQGEAAQDAQPGAESAAVSGADTAELEELRAQNQALQTQLLEIREANQASEQCIQSLREYIVQFQGRDALPASGRAPAPEAGSVTDPAQSDVGAAAGPATEQAETSGAETTEPAAEAAPQGADGEQPSTQPAEGDDAEPTIPGAAP